MPAMTNGNAGGPRGTDGATEGTGTAGHSDSPESHGRTFGLARLMLIMALLSVALTVLGGLVRGGYRRPLYLMMAAAAPVGVLVIVGLLRQFLGKQQRRSSDD